MGIVPCFDPTTGASGGAAPGGATPPGLTVAGRTNGGGYTVTAGARSLSISNPDGATLSTTVRDASNNVVPVTDSNTTTPSWTAPAGGAEGQSVQVLVTATKSGAVSRVAFTERVESSGLLGIPPIRVDLTDGTWTLYDPDSQVASISYDSATGQHTVTMNDGGNSSDYNPGAGSVFRGARWYKLLSVSGSQMTSADWLNVELITNVAVTDATFVQRNFFGTTTDPTSTDNTATAGLQVIGSCWSSLTASEQGTCLGNNFAIQNNALQETSRVVCLRGNDRVGMAAMMSLKSNNTFAAANQRFDDEACATTGNIYLVVGIGIKTSTTVITAGQKCYFGLRYVAHTIDSGAF